MKKLFAVLTALLFCLYLLASCTGESGELPASSDGGAVPADTASGSEAAGQTPEDGDIRFTVIYPDYTKEPSVGETAVMLRKTLNGLFGSGTASIDTDWVDRGKTVEDVRAAHEILLGETNRPESVSGQARLCENTAEQRDWLVTWENGHYVLCACEGYLGEAAEAFLAVVKENPETFLRAAALPEQSREHVFGKKELLSGGVPLSSFAAIVYPVTYNTEEQNEVKAFAEAFFEASGTMLPVVSASDDPGGCCLRIGSLKDERLFEAGPYSYSVTCRDTGIDLCGRDFWGEWRGMQYLLEKLSSAEDGTPLSLDAEYVRLTEKDKIGLSAWIHGTPRLFYDEAVLADCAACGFNTLILNLDEDMIFPFCKMMVKYELQGLWRLTDIGRYFDTDAAVGSYIWDEPNAEQYDEAAEEADKFRREHPGKLAYVNMLPGQALPETMKCKDYQEFLRLYFEKLRPEYGSMDEYPLRSFSPGEYTIVSWYFQSLHTFAAACREQGIPYGTYIQAVHCFDGARFITENDLRFTAYCALAFGYRDIQYYTYGVPNYSGYEYSDAVIDREGNRTPLWDGARRLNLELTSFGTVFRQYGCVGTFVAGSGKEKPFMQFEGALDGFAPLASVETEGKAVVGCFEKTEGDGYAFLCANLADPESRAEPITVTVTLAAGSGIRLYQEGETTEIFAENGRVSFTLPTACGVFAEIIG